MTDTTMRTLIERMKGIGSFYHDSDQTSFSTAVAERSNDS